MSVTLVPVTPEVARAVLAGDLSGVRAARGWPHADTYDALRPVAATDGAVGTFFVVVDGEVVGECGWFGPPGADGEVEVGYGLAAGSRGAGHGTAAVRALVAWVAAQPGVRRVAARADAGNVASRRLLERLGFALAEADGAQVRYVLPVPCTDLVWYVSYGSNLCRARFLTYLAGGVPPGGSVPQQGARDRMPPRADRRLDLPHRLYFAREASAQWGAGGVAFVEPVAGDGMTIGRAYLVTREQFEDVLRQENGWDAARPLPWDLAEPGARARLGDGWYGTALCLASLDGWPAVTFTAGERAAPVRAPSAAYLGTIRAGLRELGVADDELVAYLGAAPGVAGALDRAAILGVAVDG